ncbi:MAG: low-specificity L-threonine aldolase [bacterium]|nr:low-specificity L-threonine aldolase [candidate division KSB1 bacterium]MDH7558884.1 low-specificity L-threonine aldolase [bacterium]
MKVVDLRSDTVTKPTPGMREAMARAEVGDDVFGEDPTVNRLQEVVAELLGKEAALFVPSGTMSNQIAIKCHTQPGDEVILEADSHSFHYEGGGPAMLSGVQLHPIPGVRGVISAAQVAGAVRPGDHHYPCSRLVCIENTHNRAGGTIFPLRTIREIREVADRSGLRMHLDGARLWNAAVASGIKEREFAAPFDSVSVCLSKGLGAPVGSLIVGSRELIELAHRYRKVFGGGMRQVGIMAAAGLYALAHHRERLADDHRRARRLAEALAEMPGAAVDLASVQTNMVFVDVGASGLSAAEVVVKVREHGVLCLALGPSVIRLVTHLDVDDEGIDLAIAAFKAVLKKKRS